MLVSSSLCISVFMRVLAGYERVLVSFIPVHFKLVKHVFKAIFCFESCLCRYYDTVQENRLVLIISGENILTAELFLFLPAVFLIHSFHKRSLKISTKLLVGLFKLGGYVI